MRGVPLVKHHGPFTEDSASKFRLRIQDHHVTATFLIEYLNHALSIDDSVTTCKKQTKKKFFNSNASSFLMFIKSKWRYSVRIFSNQSISTYIPLNAAHIIKLFWNYNFTSKILGSHNLMLYFDWLIKKILIVVHINFKTFLLNVKKWSLYWSLHWHRN